MLERLDAGELEFAVLFEGVQPHAADIDTNTKMDERLFIANSQMFP